MTESGIFKAVIKLPRSQRDAYLDRVCGEDHVLRSEIESLLVAHDATGEFLHEHQPEQDRGKNFGSTAKFVGDVIAGRYKLLEEIGEGGMGTVWVAEQIEPVRRKVALKLIKAGMDSKSVTARFEAERQALAVMDHPNIAKVLDGGITDNGRPFFVMEYVKGVPITEYCDAARLDITERLSLFIQVCSAVRHAHQKGIIHRDLKPSNILVAPYDDKPVPKVIDFGLAKALNQSLTERTLHTAHETVLGTPLYMSPEQAQLNNLDVDTRSDIYSLGVVLYELLTGTTPLEKHRFKEAAWEEIKRVIREEEPPTPSTRLSSASTLPSLAACRRVEPPQLTKLIRGELDWIVMKALEKDRSRRYDTANGLGMDIQRFLSGEAVLAAPPSTLYRLSKFARKNRTPLLTMTTLSLIILCGGAMVFSVQAKAARERAAVAADRAVRAAATNASVTEAVREAKVRVDDAWNLSDYPDRMKTATDAAVAAINRADSFLVGGTATSETRLQIDTCRREVDELVRHARLISSCEFYQRQFADDLTKGTPRPRTKLAIRLGEAFQQYGLDPIKGDLDQSARMIAESRLRDPLLGYLLVWHLHAKAVSESLQKTPTQDTSTNPMADPAIHQRLMQVVREARKLCGADYARWQDLLDRKDIPGLVAFAKTPAALNFRAPLVNDLGRNLANEDQYAACRDFLRSATDRYPHDVWLQYDLFMACMLDQPPAWSEALRYCSAASIQWPDCALFRVQLGECYLGLQSFDQAIAAFEKAMSIYADSSYSKERLNAAIKEKEAFAAKSNDVAKAKQEPTTAAGELGLLQGAWERPPMKELQADLGAARVVKHIKGDKETVVWYDAKGEILRSHLVFIKVNGGNMVTRLTYSDMEILSGPEKGQKRSVSGSYVYLVEQENLYQVKGMVTTDPEQRPYMETWRRLPD